MFLLHSAGWREVSYTLGVSFKALEECFRHWILKSVSPVDQKSTILIDLCTLYRVVVAVIYCSKLLVISCVVFVKIYAVYT